MMTLMRFAEKWSSDGYPPEHVAESDLRKVEERLDFRLPDDYLQAVLQVGLPSPTIALLDAVVERELDLHVLSEFYTPAEIIKETIVWREIGMPEQLVAFASDDCGNKFCFDANRLDGGSTKGRAIWFFDHDFGTLNQISPSFDIWIEAFCNVEQLPEVD